jgi:hypothetical protein
VKPGSCCIAEGRHLPVIKVWSGPILPDLGTGPQGVFSVQLHTPKTTRERPLMPRWERLSSGSMSVVHGGFASLAARSAGWCPLGFLRRLAGYVMIALHRMFR